jgi:hypothetical protein
MGILSYPTILTLHTHLQKRDTSSSCSFRRGGPSDLRESFFRRGADGLRISDLLTQREMSDGALLELVSRGKKDAYFIQGGRRTWFGTEYERRPAQTRDIRLAYPIGPVSFDHWFDIELPRDSDILMSVDIRIKMPTWLPSPVAAVNRTKIVEVDSGTKNLFGQTVWARYGWTNGISNYLFGRWALFADNYMLTEGWGEFNSWFPDMETTQNRAPIIHASTGTHNGSERRIQWNAAPPELVFRVPLIGCQGDEDVGLPLCALKGQRLYLRFWVLPKEKLVESGKLPGLFGELPKYQVCPAPWGGRAIRIRENDGDPTGVISPYTTLQEWEIGAPYVYARFGVLNVEEDVCRALRSQPIQILFRQQQREDWIIEDNQWNPVASYRHQLEIHGYFQALFLGFISNARRSQNKYRDINPPGGGEWVLNLGLNVNGTDRLHFWPPKKFQELANNTQMARDVEVALYYLIFGVNPEREPGGACALSRTAKAVLHLNLADVPKDPAEDNRQAAASLLGLSWNVFEIRESVGRLFFID